MAQREAMSGPSMAPPWLCGYNSNGQKFLYNLGLALDALLDKQRAAMLAKLPGQADPSAIPFQAADRLMVQGPAETNDQFVERMSGALDAWALAGSRHAILEQIQGYLTGLQPGVALAWPECLIVGGFVDVSNNDSATTWDTIFGSTPQGDAPAHAYVTPANWDWDGQLQPWRAWLVLFMNLVATGQSGASANVVAAVGGFVTVTGLSGMTSDNVQQYLTLSGSTSPANNGTFQIVSLVDSTSVVIANPPGLADSTSIAWSVGAYPYIGPAPVWGAPGKVWGSDSTWGLNCSPLVIQSIRQILQQWKSAGTYYPNIIVSFGGGDGSAGNSFTPLAETLTVTPDIGVAASPPSVTVSAIGSRVPFSTGATVTFGGLAAGSVVVVDDETITCVPPAGTGSTTPIDVVVTNTDGSTVTLAGAFTYFDPTVVPNMVLWLDSRVGAGITQAAGLVTAWTDKSGAGHNAVFPVGQNPSYTASNPLYNSLPSVGFTGTKRFTLPALGLTSGGLSVLYIGHQGNKDADFFGSIEATPKMRAFSSGGQLDFTRDGIISPDSITGGVTVSPYVMLWTTAGANQSLYASSIVPRRNSTATATDLTGKTYMVGNYGGGANALFTQGGPIVQMAVWSRALTDSEARYLERGFGQIYGITIYTGVTSSGQAANGDPPGVANADGTWGSIGKLVDGAWVPARRTLNPFDAFCDGTGKSVGCYEKNRG